MRPRISTRTAPGRTISRNCRLDGSRVGSAPEWRQLPFTISKPFPASFEAVPRGRGLMAKILKFLRNFAYAVAGFGLLILAIGTAEAAGALAVGSCGAYGYGFDYHRE